MGLLMSGNHALETTYRLSLLQQRGLIIALELEVLNCITFFSFPIASDRSLKEKPQRIFVNVTERNIDLSNGTQVAAGRSTLP